MTTLTSSLADRREEFDGHYALAKALEDRMMLEEVSSLGTVSLSARHINTIKSGLIIHLYNIEEAILTQALGFLGEAIGASEPRNWTSHSLKEWLRETVVGRMVEGGEDGRLDTIFSSSAKLLSTTSLGPQLLKKPSGTWDDKAVALFMRRANIRINMPPEMWVRISPKPEYGDMTALQFLAERRNAIAHGRRTFEQGANDLQLADIKQLSEVVLDYLSYVADAFQNHVAVRAHLVPAA
ncbi:MAE_28990/MAE_18760 family HEPN-like nuclease [Brevundimonas vesicularis]|uniref:MAE_28990/MAE_18760 family HEPN-like nuclease n=1 Tax=Brevundimonas vesicularis TaxID=41276 RepID=UPI0022EC57BC|nr:MAE_28990/MAE_18760 family HEPN-like nuclease [Brevundimonas vesicularis]WBT04804.1 MAE_28990/MAE_18760 family HEPN-like nuclease [Brevundimonas vesicularis]WBT04888.1 MAE_28990/MAE_18760 family HEPN-like nuclease [Brevundimonas vesicularis]